MQLKRWYVLDVLRQAHGPYTSEDVKALLRRGSHFFVASSTYQNWVPVEFVPEFTFVPRDAAPTQVSSGPAAVAVEQAMIELIGVCKGVIADGKVTPEEAAYLREWLAGNTHLSPIWPVNVLTRRLEAIFADGQVDAEEQAELLRMLTRISAAKPMPFAARRDAVPLPITLPEPKVTIAGRAFCLAGAFIYGTRARCEEEILMRGGRVVAEPNAPADYVVLGTLSHADWQKSPDVAKLQSVLELQAQGLHMTVITEEHWADALDADAQVLN
ncbi:MAG TPA: hypothetical protein VF678_03585 [bacterium]